MDTKLIRSYLQQGHITEAFRLFNAQAPSELRQRATQLYAQFTTLDTTCRVVPTLGFTHSRLLYTAFHLVSLYETRYRRGGPAAGQIASLERDLSAAYRRLAALGRQSLIDRFMRWMIKHQPAQFYELVQHEKLTGAPANMLSVLGGLDLEAFRRHAGVRMPLALMHQLLCERGRETPDFFCHWLDHAAYRIRYSKMLLEAVEQSRQLHTALLNGEDEPQAVELSAGNTTGELTIGEVIAQFEREGG